ncbi:MAG: hypothetical protein D6808_07250 [Candidatus Dadabacteria bacterium]|nr:MAG: hypothetical protein D6808_07250 [Candidatus Dadabacteria bacterium]
MELPLVHILAISTISLYLFSSVIYLWSAATGRSLMKGAELAASVAFVLHTATFGLLMLREQSFPLGGSGDFSFMISWGVSAVYIVYLLQYKRIKSSVLGAFVLPISAFVLATSSYLVHLQRSPFEGETNLWILVLHVVPALLSEVSLVLLFVMSGVFLVQESRLKRLASGAFKATRLSLDAIDRLCRLFTVVGFVAMGVAVISGALWAISNGESLATPDFVQWLALAVWVLFGLFLHLRTLSEWSSRRISVFVLRSVGALLAVFFVFTFFSDVNLVHERF